MLRRCINKRGNGRWQHQRRCSAAKEDGCELATRRQRRLIGHIRQQRGAPCVIVHRVAHMAIEVTIGTFGNAKRPVNVEGEGDRHQISYPISQEGRSRKYCCNQLAERVCPMAHCVFFCGVEFGKGLAAAFGHKNRVIAKP